jgi:DNA primase
MLLKITREDIDRVKALNSIVAVIHDRGIDLDGRGRHVFARCPFHRENTPSFCVTESKGLFHCFGCGVAGDVIGFVVRYDRISFPEAVRKLAQRAGILLREEKENARRADTCGRTTW